MTDAPPPTYEEVVSPTNLPTRGHYPPPPHPLDYPRPDTPYPGYQAPYPPLQGDGGAYPHATTAQAHTKSPTTTDKTPLITPGPPSYTAIDTTSEVQGVDTGRRAPSESTKNVKAGCIGFVGLAIFAALPCAMIYLGYTNLGGCSARPNVPLFCLISGCLALAAFASFYFMLLSKEGSGWFNLWIGVVALCIVVHFGVQCWGSYLVFRYWSTWTEYKDVILEYNLCDEDTFLMSFATLIMYWIIMPCLYSVTKSSN